MYGLIFDPGAAEPLIGMDTLLDYLTDVLDPLGLEAPMVQGVQKQRFSGIDCQPQESAGVFDIPLGLGPLTFTWRADAYGHGGSTCPGLWSNQECRRINRSAHWNSSKTVMAFSL